MFWYFFKFIIIKRNFISYTLTESRYLAGAILNNIINPMAKFYCLKNLEDLDV